MSEISRRGILAAAAAGAVDGTSAELSPRIARDNLEIGTLTLSTVINLTSSSLKGSTNTVSISGFHRPGIGAFSVRRVNSRPPHPWCFRSVDRFLPNGVIDSTNGGWWEGIYDDGSFDVRSFGAVGDGRANDTTAIQNALDMACYLHRGVIKFPAGVFNLQPASWNAFAALYIAGDNITLLGAGRDFTKLRLRLYDGSHPATSWSLLDGKVHRGHCICIVHKPGGTRQNIFLQDLEIDGQTHTTGEYSFPANPKNGDGWDITNHGIHLEENKAFDNIVVDNCYVHGFRGELIYYGGAGLNRIRVSNNLLGDTNGDAISFSAANELVNQNEFFSAAAAGVENAYVGGTHRYIGNVFRDIQRFALCVFPAEESGPFGTVEISSNHFLRCNTLYNFSVIRLEGAKNTKVFNNEFCDCSGACIVADPVSHGGSNRPDVKIVSEGLEIYNNTFITNTINNMTYGIQLFSTSVPWVNLIVRDNTAYRTSLAIAQQFSFAACLGFNESGILNYSDGCAFERNHSNDGAKDNTKNARVGPILLTRAGITGLASVVTKRLVPIMKAKFAVRVRNSATVVSCIVAWFDATGWHLAYPAKSVNLPVGDYYFEFATTAGGGDGFQLNTSAQASLANNVTVAVEIEGM